MLAKDKARGAGARLRASDVVRSTADASESTHRHRGLQGFCVPREGGLTLSAEKGAAVGRRIP
jgi:hypothetical protein